MRRQGFSLLELIVSLFLGGILSILCVRELHHLAITHRRLMQQIALLRNSTLMIPHLQRALFAQDRHRLDLSPRTASGVLRFNDGTPFPIHVDTAPDSTTIYYLTTAAISPLPLLARQSQGSSITATICPITPIPTRNSRFDAIALTPQGLFEVKNRILSHTPSGCLEIELSAIHPLLCDPLANTHLLTVSLILPLIERAALFIDEKQTARMVRLHGDMIIENQPLAARLTGMQCSLARDSFGLDTLSCSLFWPHDKSLSLHFRNRLSREPLINILLNL